MLLLLITLCFFVIIYYTSKPGGIIFLPTVISVLYLFWLVPQIYLISAQSTRLAGFLLPYVSIAGLSLVAACVGWNVAKPLYSQTSIVERTTDPSIVAVSMLTGASLVFAVLLEGIRDDVKDIQQWSGPATIISFFAQIRILPLALALLLYLRRRSALTLLLLLVNATIVLPIAVVYLRRSEMIEIAVIVVGTYWFAKRRLPSRALMGLTSFGLFLVVFLISDLRGSQWRLEQTTGQQVWIFDSRLWSNINLQSALQKRISEAPDVVNGIYLTAYTLSTTDVALGADTWNGLVRQYVPAQLVGAELKDSLMIGEKGAFIAAIAQKYKHRYQQGTTSTGIGSVVRELHLLGFLIFGLIGWLLGILYRSANQGDVWKQALYVCLLPSALVAFTHGHDTFFASLPLFFSVWKLGTWMDARLKLKVSPRRHTAVRQPSSGI